MKNSITDSPSLKLLRIGSSMISPDGLAISPRMPASWRICCRLPRAPDASITCMGLKPCRSDSSSAISSLVMSSLVVLQTSMTRL